ncbi:MAG: hypothetical protein P1V97_17590 [Planctomycetota bacterium]|nr:hypothetical protein [Planctomycetota bacterium]
MNRKRLDRMFTDAVRGCDVLSDDDLDYALGFQSHARKTTGRSYPIDRILLKFGYLEEVQIHALYKAIRYFRWRKEDKFFLKIAIQSNLLSERRANLCLQEQKELYKDREELMRVNEIARRRVYLTEKQERAVIDAIKKIKGTTITATEITLDKAESAPKLTPRKRSKTEKPKAKAKTKAKAAPSEILKESSASSRSSGSAVKRRRSKVDPFDDQLSEPGTLPPMEDSDDDFLPMEDSRESIPGLSDSGESFAPLDSAEDDSPFQAFESDEDDHFQPLDSDEDDHFQPLESDEDDGFDPLESSDDGSFEPRSTKKDFDAFRTENEMDSILPLHEDDHLDNLAKSARKKGGKKGSKKKSAKGKKRRDPFAENQSKNMKVLSDDELDALWEEADLDALDLDSDNRNVAPSPLLDSDDELDYSSSDDLF